MMWLFVFTSFMLFAAFTSGFIVYAGGRGHGINVILPDVFKYSTAVIIISSITLFLASRAAKRLEVAKPAAFFMADFCAWSSFFSGTDYMVGIFLLTKWVSILLIQMHRGHLSMYLPACTYCTLFAGLWYSCLVPL